MAYQNRFHKLIAVDEPKPKLPIFIHKIKNESYMQTGSFSQIYIHIVFAVKGRDSLIGPTWEESLYKHITGIVRKKGQKMLAINGMPDHIHFLIGMRPTCVLDDLMEEVGKSSTEFINNEGLAQGMFEWQKGFGAFSCSYSDLGIDIAFIMNQKEHHRHKTFKEEYIEFLEKHQIEYDERFLFEWIE